MGWLEFILSFELRLFVSVQLEVALAQERPHVISGIVIFVPPALLTYT
jgi:hypothetical protein